MIDLILQAGTIVTCYVITWVKFYKISTNVRSGEESLALLKMVQQKLIKSKLIR